MTSSSILTTFPSTNSTFWEVLHRLHANRIFAHADKMWVPCHFLWIPWIYAVTWRPYHVPIQSSNHPDWPIPQRFKDIQSFFSFAISTIISFMDILKSQFHLCILTHKGTPGISLMSATLPLKHLKRLSPQLWSLPIDPGHSKLQLRLNTSGLCTCHCPFNYDSWWQLASYCIPLLDLFCPGTQLRCPWQRATHNIWSFQTMVTLPWRLWTSDWCVTDHRNLQYFSWTNPHALTSMLVQIPFWIQLVSVSILENSEPNPMHSLDDGVSILKRGIVTMPASIHRTTAQYSLRATALSLWATTLSIPVLRVSLIMDAERLHSDIQSQLWEDPISTEHLDNQSDPSGPSILMVYYTTSDTSMFWTLAISDYMFYVLTQPSPCRSFWSDKDPSSSPYAILLVWTSSLCQGLLQIHAPLVPCQTCAPQALQTSQATSNSWEALEFHIYGFHREAPSIFRLYLILVIVDHLSKQSLFIPTHDTITITTTCTTLHSTCLFPSMVFQATSLPIMVQKFVSHFFWSLGTVLDMKLHFTSGYHPEGDGQTEWTNQTLEQYLWVYCNYQQDNWSELLPLAEFAL